MSMETMPFASGEVASRFGHFDNLGDVAGFSAITESFYCIGNCVFVLAGTGGFVEHVRAECAPLEIAATTSVDIHFDFRQILPPMPGYTVAAPLKIGDGCYETLRDRVAYQVRTLQTGYQVYVLNDIKRKHNVPDLVRRFHDRDFHTPEENAAKDFVYGVLGYLVQIVNLSRGTSYLHASSFEKGGRGIALIAWRGIGKTAAMLKLVNEYGWKYLSDDLAVVGPPQNLSRSARLIQLHGYNLCGEKALTRRIFLQRNYWDRWAWAFRKQRHGLAGVRRRVSAEELFGADAIAAAAPLVSPILMERADISNFQIEPISTTDLAQRAANIVLTELEPFVEIATALKAFAPAMGFPGPDEFLEHTIAVLEDRFAGLDAQHIRVPITATPNALAAYLQATLG